MADLQRGLGTLAVECGLDCEFVRTMLLDDGRNSLVDRLEPQRHRAVRPVPDNSAIDHRALTVADIDDAVAGSECSRVDAEDDAVYVNLGMAYEKKGMLAEAIGAYKTAYELNPDAKKAAMKYREIKIKMLQQQNQE